MRILAVAGPLALMGLASCSAGPESYATMTTGVGFGDYQRYLHSREASSTGSVPYSVPPERAAAPLLPPASMPANPPSSLAAVPLRSLPPPTPIAVQPVSAQPLPAPMAAPAPVAAPMIALAPPAPMAMPQAAAVQTAAVQTAAAQPAPMQPAPVYTAAVQTAAPAGSLRTVQASASFGTTPAFDAGPSLTRGVSDEQDFRAVSSRETIESDRERLARQRAQYQVIEVASVPPPTASAGPNIVAFALSVSHAPGTQVYRRINPLRWGRWENACLEFRNQDSAQEAFLANGGPERDGDNLDPDGDGYACWWDPTPLRQALASR